MTNHRQWVACDECGNMLQIIRTQTLRENFQLRRDRNPPNAAEYTAGAYPNNRKYTINGVTLECAHNYGHRTGWAIGASGYVERVEELTNDGP